MWDTFLSAGLTLAESLGFLALVQRQTELVRHRMGSFSVLWGSEHSPDGF